MLFPQIPYNNLKQRMSYAVNAGAIKKLRRGIYVKDAFNVFELSNRLYAPSYVSLETVLQKAGVVFQYDKSVFAISYITRTVQVDTYTLVYRKIKNDILLNAHGIEKNGGSMVASKERAFLDAVFLYKNYHFDNLRPLDWTVIMELKNIYESKALKKRVEEYYQIYKNDHV